MSDLDDAIEEIEQVREGDLDRALCTVEEPEGYDIAEFSGVDLIVLRANGDAIIARVGWGSTGIHLDVRAFLEGEQVSAEAWDLAGTTSVMAVRP